MIGGWILKQKLSASIDAIWLWKCNVRSGFDHILCRSKSFGACMRECKSTPFKLLSCRKASRTVSLAPAFRSDNSKTRCCRRCANRDVFSGVSSLVSSFISGELHFVSRALNTDLAASFVRGESSAGMSLMMKRSALRRRSSRRWRRSRAAGRTRTASWAVLRRSASWLPSRLSLSWPVFILDTVSCQSRTWSHCFTTVGRLRCWPSCWPVSSTVRPVSGIL